MRIAVLGTGNIGGTLGTRWQQAGHEVAYGSRKPRPDGPGGTAVLAVSDAIEGSDAIVLAVPAGAVRGVVTDLGARLDGAVVVDATNDIGSAVANARETIAAAAPTARYVRAFNTLGWENFADPLPNADLFFAADETARDVAEQLITDVGLRPVYVGDGAAAGRVDALLGLWLGLAQQRGNRRLAFRALW